MRILLATTLVLLVLTPVQSSIGIQTKQSQAINAFWANFKAAVARNDREAVASMTQLPFIFDNKELSKAQFIKSYNLIFDRKTQRCFARAKPVKEEGAIPGFSIFCGQEIFGFELVDGKYKFTGIGAND